MPFALTSVQLEAALKEPGCPICRLSEEAVQKSADGFLYENTMNPDWRKPIMEAHGFCPTHTKLMVAVEMSSSGPVLGINYIYEQLARQVADELAAFQPGLKGLRQKIAAHLPLKRGTGPICPLCEFQAQSDTNLLSGLFEELNSEKVAFRDLYTQSDGLCYTHLSAGLQDYGADYPTAARFLVQLTRQRLEQRSADMREYIRKHDWHYKDEKLSEEEWLAWKRTVTFFTGLPEEQFNHKIEKR